MSSYSERDTASQAGDGMLAAVRRHPEALLLMAAGCCLMMRSGSSSRTSARHAYERDEWDPTSRAFSQGHGASASAREEFSRATEDASNTARSAAQVKDRIANTASDYASQMKDRISDTAGSYVDSVKDLADDARRAITERSARLSRQTQATLQSSMQRVLREQPLAVALIGLAAGAAVAALFPSTEIENRAFGGAHEKLKEAAEKTGERVMDAAGKAGERLKSAAEERALTSEGLKEVAGEVADTFKDAISGKPEDRSASPGPSAAEGASSQGFGMDQSKSGGSHSSSPGERSVR
jgi:hypothetical protein